MTRNVSLIFFRLACGKGNFTWKGACVNFAGKSKKTSRCSTLQMLGGLIKKNDVGKTSQQQKSPKVNMCNIANGSVVSPYTHFLVCIHLQLDCLILACHPSSPSLGVVQVSSFKQFSLLLTVVQSFHSIALAFRSSSSLKR